MENDIISDIFEIGGDFMEDLYVTVTGFSHYYGKKPFSIGNVLICVKEPENRYDSEAIQTRLPFIGQIGHIANGFSNVAGGTMSAGRIYDKVEDKFYVRVIFTTQSKIICRVETGKDEDYEKELTAQMLANEELFRGM